MDAIVAARSKKEFQMLLRDASSILDGKNPQEISTIRCWAFSPYFESIIADGSNFSLNRLENDPPDFSISSSSGTIGVEVTTFTQDKLEVWMRQRNGGSYTSMLLSGKANKAFRSQLQSHTLPSDSLIFPDFVQTSKLDDDYFEVAERVISKKAKDLLRYKHQFDQTLLLIMDKLSGSHTRYKARTTRLLRYTSSLPEDQRFDAVILLDNDRSEKLACVRI